VLSVDGVNASELETITFTEDMILTAAAE
jgi:hypothetical protein